MQPQLFVVLFLMNVEFSKCLPKVATQAEIDETDFIIMDKPDFCEFDAPLAIVIKSGLTNYQRRGNQRKSFLNDATDLGIKYVYVLGSSENQKLIDDAISEDEKYQDIIMGKPIDDYYNLTLKSIFSLNWISKRCPEKWILYMDDDAFVNIPAVLEFIRKFGSNYRIPLCSVMGPNYPVIRDVGNRYEVPKSVFGPDVYPPYCSGHGTLYPPGVVSVLANATLKAHPRIWIDDAFIGIALKYANLTLVQRNEFLQCVSGSCDLLWILENFFNSWLIGDVGGQLSLEEIWRQIKIVRMLLEENKRMKLHGTRSRTRLLLFPSEIILILGLISITLIILYLITTKSNCTRKQRELLIA